jgi:cytochrome c553
MASQPTRCAALCLALGLAWCGGPVALAQAQPANPNPATLAACAACHGVGGQSSTPAVPSLAAQPRTFIENQLVLIREGLRDVPAMKGVMAAVDDAEIAVLARYFAAQPAQRLPGTLLPEKARVGAELSRRALCGGCHLPGYVGQNQVPRLAGQQEAYLLATMKMYRDKPEAGRDTLMSGPLAGMKDAELDSLAHYLAHHGK